MRSTDNDFLHTERSALVRVLFLTHSMLGMVSVVRRKRNFFLLGMSGSVLFEDFLAKMMCAFGEGGVRATSEGIGRGNWR